MTLEEKKGLLGNNLKMAYVGDGNNVLHALMLACAMMGVNLAAGCPEGYPPDPKYVAEARKRAAVSGATLEIVTDPRAAVQDADAVYTDVWASMGQEAESAMRAQLFRSYQLNAELLARAKPDAIALHCLPAHRGEEISEEIMESHAEAIYEQAENRMHTQKALLAMIIGL
jgi:ornithine carbamoyltransferase